MSDELVKAMFSKPKLQPVFEIGQTVRVISRIDMNMPKDLDYWLNAKCKVLSIVPRGFGCREWCYELMHDNGRTCEFKASELDLRYRKRKFA